VPDHVHGGTLLRLADGHDRVGIPGERDRGRQRRRAAVPRKIRDQETV
jgi:hypothetical protein